MGISPGPVAPWRQLHTILERQITSGELQPGSRLPSMVSLSQEYGLAISTVKKAIDRLREDGLVVTSTMGTFVAEK